MKTGLLLALFAVSLQAEWLVQPPPLLRIIQTVGTRPALENPIGDTAAGVYLFGATSLTGRAETWLLETHDSFASLEQFDAGIAYPSRGRNAGGEESRTWIAFYRHWWSHLPEEAVQAFRKARYLQISIYHTGLGNETEFANMLQERKRNLSALNLNRPDLVYQVLSGAPSGLYLVISPLPSLAALDDGVSRSAAGYLRASGAPFSRPGGSTVTPGSNLSHENLIFRLEPTFSVVSSDFLDQNPGFWKPAR